MLADKEREVEAYREAVDQSEALLQQIERQSTTAVEQVRNQNLDLHNQVKHLEGQLALFKTEGERREAESRTKEAWHEQELLLTALTKDKERLLDEQVVHREQIEALKAENGKITARLDSLLAVTQKDRVQSTVDKLDLSAYVEEIARLKKSEQQLKLRLKQQSLSQSSTSKSAADATAKYAQTLEECVTLKTQLSTCQGQLAAQMAKN